MVFRLFGDKRQRSAPSPEPVASPVPSPDPGGLIAAFESVRALPFMAKAELLFDHPYVVFFPWADSEAHLYAPQRRDDPRGMAAAFAALSDSVWWERTLRGYLPRSPVGKPLMPELLPELGLVVERIPGDGVETIIYAGDAAPCVPEHHYRAGLDFIDCPRAQLPCWQTRAAMMKAWEEGILQESTYWAGQYVAYFSEIQGHRGSARWYKAAHPPGNKMFMPLFAPRLESVTVPLASGRDGHRRIEWDRPDMQA